MNQPYEKVLTVPDNSSVAQRQALKAQNLIGDKNNKDFQQHQTTL